MKKISRKSFLKLAAATTAGTAMAPALMGCAWPDTQDHTPYKGDIVLLLSNDIHSNLGTSKIMSTDGSTRITGGVARMAAAQAGVRHRAFGKTLTLDGGDYSQGTPYQDGYQKGWEILALAEMQVDFCTWATTNSTWAIRPSKTPGSTPGKTGCATGSTANCPSCWYPICSSNTTPTASRSLIPAPTSAPMT